MASTYPLSYSAPASALSATTPTAPTVLIFGATGEDITTAYKATLAYLVIIVLLWAFSKTRIGYAAIYYGLCLILLLLLVTQYRWIAAILAPLSSQTPPPPGPMGISGLGGVTGSSASGAL
jgi:hypothetical protein